jgi:hypothetical protein
VLPELTAAFVLLALCVVVHAAGLSLALRWLARASPAPAASRRARTVGTFVAVASWLLTLHLVEITAWALLYVAIRCLPDFETALYFSGVTYTTLGYGDIVLPQQWQILGPMEGLTGILMCGLSTGFFFLIVMRLYERLVAAQTRPNADR